MLKKRSLAGIQRRTILRLSRDRLATVAAQRVARMPWDAHNSVAEKCLNERTPYICVQSGVSLTSAFLLSLPGHGHADREAHGLQDDAPVPPQNSYP